MLFAIEKQLALYRKRIEELFARHPDHDLFGSLPGAGPKIAPRLFSEMGDDRERFAGEFQNLQCLAGTAPVTKRSGKHRNVISAGPVTNTSVTPSTFLRSRAFRVAPGPRFTISIIAKRTRATPMRCADSVIAGSKSFTRCGSIEPPTTPNSITVIN